MEDALIPLRPVTDFQKLLYANRLIDELQKELKTCKISNGQLQSRIDELEYEDRLKEQSDKEFLKITKKDMLELKKGKILSEMSAKVKSLTDRNNQFRDVNNDLVHQIVMFKKL